MFNFLREKMNGQRGLRSNQRSRKMIREAASRKACSSGRKEWSRRFLATELAKCKSLVTLQGQLGEVEMRLDRSRWT